MVEETVFDFTDETVIEKNIHLPTISSEVIQSLLKNFSDEPLTAVWKSLKIDEKITDMPELYNRLYQNHEYLPNHIEAIIFVLHNNENVQAKLEENISQMKVTSDCDEIQPPSISFLGEVSLVTKIARLFRRDINAFLKCSDADSDKNEYRFCFRASKNICRIFIAQILIRKYQYSHKIYGTFFCFDIQTN